MHRSSRNASVAAWLWIATGFGLWSCSEAAPPSEHEPAPTLLELPVVTDRSALDPGVERDLDAALAAAKAAPESVEDRFALALFLDANSLLEPAYQAYQQTRQLDPGHARAAYHAARMLRALGRFEPAREQMERALELAPQVASVHRRSGEWWLQDGEFEAARAAFNRCRSLDSSQPDGTLGLARLALLNEDFESAEALAREVLEARPEVPYAHHLLGTALRDQGRGTEAEAAFAQAGDGVPVWNDPWVDEVEAHLSGSGRLLVEAQACLEKGLFEQACTRLVQLHAQTPDDVTVQGMWTAALTKLGRHEEALEMLLAARARQPEHFRIELNLAIVRWKQGKLDLAEQHLERSLVLNPAHEAVFMVQGQVLGDRGDREGAIRAFESALQLGGEPRRILPRLGKLQMDLQRWDVAVQTYARATAENPRDASLQATLAGCLAEFGDLPAARTSLSRARELDASLALLPMIEARLEELSGADQP